MTSPPYFGLRDYHVEGQLGLEPTYEEYVDKLIEIFCEVKRVLKSDGSLYLNLGDTYSTALGRHANRTASLCKVNMVTDDKKPPQPKNLPAKCLVGIPWRVALRMVDSGWILRNDIIWHKPNAMPSSVKDRLANTYEHIFHFVKSRRYYYNLDAIRVPHKTKSGSFNIRVRDAQKGRLGAKWGGKYSASESEIREYNEKLYEFIREISELAKRYRTEGYEGKSTEDSNRGWNEVLKSAHAHRKATKKVIEKYGITGELESALKDYAQNHWGNALGKNPGDVVKHDIAVGRSPHSSYSDPLHTKPNHPKGKNPGDVFSIKERIGDAHEGEATANLYRAHVTHNSKGKNPGDFWEITTKPHPFAHFAVYPEEICVRPILSSSRVGDLVLDPFAGSGTTGVVAKKLGRNFIGIEIKQEYAEIAERRILEVEENSLLQ